jgi:Zn-finger nucleic acid-binding protein
MAGGAAYCSTCGLALGDPAHEATHGPCPGCGRELQGWHLDASGPYRGGHPVAACHGCGGVWLPLATQRAMIDAAAAEADRQGEVATHAVVRQQLPVGILAAAVVYRSCPKCSTTMSRKNFGGCSGVIVDECRCGTYFDAGELESVLAFVRSGGMQLSRRRAEDERKRRELMPPPEQREGGTSWMAAEARDPSFSLAQWIAQWIIGR